MKPHLPSQHFNCPCGAVRDFLREVPDCPGYWLDRNGHAYSTRVSLEPLRMSAYLGPLEVKENVNHRRLVFEFRKDDGTRKRVHVATAMMETWVGPMRGRRVRHLDLDGTNNRLDNLYFQPGYPRE